ncbi:NAD(P)/FAD-dependent oxidoreductase [Martelella endophytica]|uniref:FAD-dependent oxidoreductase n=1 Tax=Martelella endophytica TaxID=1486262 RepID=A0A0D5LL87_MAREN|nr:FAD-binding oxidoreductase [Martelella endophytica]AJY44532.1 FAD-dependent oxidoreductase [Martelella endophytica]
MAITNKTDLRAARPFWAATPNIRVETQSTPDRKDYDVIVVGAGISGALITRMLADGRRRILVLDRRRPVHGSTMASTAMIQYEIDLPLTKLAGLLGETRAIRAWQRSAKAVEGLESLVETHGIECAWERKRALFLAGDEYGAGVLRKEAGLRAENGLSAEFLEAGKLGQEYGLERAGAIRSDCSASANPAQLTAGLFRSLGPDVSICSPVEVTDYRESDGEVVLATSDGRLLSAGHVIFCTGYEFLKPMQSKHHQIIATWAAATPPHASRPDWLASHIVWEGSDPYLYFRTTPDGRIIAGGEDEAAAGSIENTEKMARKIARIRNKLEALLGSKVDDFAYHWAARFGNTDDGLPIIDCAPGCRRVFSVMGFGGNGITFSMIAGQIVSQWVAGKADPDADLFAYR